MIVGCEEERREEKMRRADGKEGFLCKFGSRTDQWRAQPAQALTIMVLHVPHIWDKTQASYSARHWTRGSGGRR